MMTEVSGYRSRTTSRKVIPSISGIRMSETIRGGSPMRSRTSSASRPEAGLEALKALGLEHPDEESSHPGLVVHDEACGGAGHDRLRELACRHGSQCT